MSDKTPLTVFIRTASKRDLTQVKSLLAETWHHTYDPIFGAEMVDEITAEWHSLDALERSLSAPASEFVLADDGETIHGMAFASQLDKTVTLYQLYVLPASQGRGVGTEIMQELFFCFDQAERMELDVHPENENAIGFYKAGGFEEIRAMEVRGPGGVMLPHVVLARALDD